MSQASIEPHRTQVIGPDPHARYALPDDGKATCQNQHQQCQPSVCCCQSWVGCKHSKQPEERCQAEVTSNHHHPEDEEVTGLQVEADHEVDDAAEQGGLHDGDWQLAECHGLQVQGADKAAVRGNLRLPDAIIKTDMSHIRCRNS